MNARKKAYEPEYAVNVEQRIKTVRLRVGVTDAHLERRIKTAFEVAKSAGRELDLTFS